MGCIINYGFHIVKIFVRKQSFQTFYFTFSDHICVKLLSQPLSLQSQGLQAINSRFFIMQQCFRKLTTFASIAVKQNQQLFS